MDYKNIVKEMINLFEKSSLHSLEMEIPGVSLSLKKGKDENDVDKVSTLHKEESIEIKEESISQNDKELIDYKKECINAPLVGTLYMAPEPNKAPFVKLGQKVKAGDTLCIIEAMKMMNELKAPYDLIIKNILLENGTMVEYDESIFEVEKC